MRPAVPPTVTITSPVAMTPPTAAAPLPWSRARITFAGTATDEDEPKSVEISLRNNTTRESLASDGTWGANSVSAYYRISPTNLNAATYNWSYTTRAADGRACTTSGSGPPTTWS